MVKSAILAGLLICAPALAFADADDSTTTTTTTTQQQTGGVVMQVPGVAVQVGTPDDCKTRVTTHTNENTGASHTKEMTRCN